MSTAQDFVTRMSLRDSHLDKVWENMMYGSKLTNVITKSLFFISPCNNKDSKQLQQRHFNSSMSSNGFPSRQGFGESDVHNLIFLKTKVVSD